MQVLVISDIHGNLTALDTVLADAGEHDAVWCLGDLVGYGPDPNECIERVRALPDLTCLVGNHDKAAIGEIDISAFNVDARQAINWTGHALSPAGRDYLLGLPERVEHGPYTLVHASPRQPVWEYILDRHIAAQNFNYFNTPYCLVGHTHLPILYIQTDGVVLDRRPNYDELLALGDERMIINPGSVGQPRDSNPDAAYALLDTDTQCWEFRRVPYDIAETQQRMAGHGLPPRLIARLEKGW
ncbi:MAG: metallophosphoesterase family protein [Chloroflexi bacterium]|nr:metallophosphoesterase family protein [Chloroflexota bacterium]MBI5829313.1 metallophosphoesterase family protein [Chloroflexota bacterium]